MLNQDRVARFARFCTVGGFITCLDLLLVALFSQWLTPFAAVSLSYLIAVACHFSLNKFWVFRCSRGDYVRQISQYLMAALLTWLTTICVVKLALGWITSSVVIAKIIALPPATLIGFLGLRLFVFRTPSKIQSAPRPTRTDSRALESAREFTASPGSLFESKVLSRTPNKFMLPCRKVVPRDDFSALR
jgi:putative flippase GtrA